MAEDYYKILGLEYGATKAEIRQSYHKLAKLYHPDRNRDDPDAEKRFMAISEAYKALSDSALVYYQVLGINRGTALGDIKRAYYRLSEQHHLAARAGDPAAARRLEEVRQAFEYLVGKEDAASVGEEDGGW